MSFMDVLSVSLCGVLLLYILQPNPDQTSDDQKISYTTIIEQEKDATDHFKCIIVMSENDTIVYNYSRLKRNIYYMGDTERKPFDLRKASFFAMSDKEKFLNAAKSKFPVQISIRKGNNIPAYIRMINGTSIKKFKVLVGFGACSNADLDHPVSYVSRSLINEDIERGELKFFNVNHDSTYQNCQNCLFGNQINKMPNINIVRIDVDGVKPNIIHLNDSI